MFMKFGAAFENTHDKNRRLGQERGRSILDDCRADMIKEQEKKGSVRNFSNFRAELLQLLEVFLLVAGTRGICPRNG